MTHPECPERPGIIAESEARVRLVGPLDAFSALSVEEELGSLAAERAVLTVDLSDVDVLTSGGLAVLERCRAVAAAAGHRLLFEARPGGIVQRVLQVAGALGLEPVPEDGAPAATPAVTGGA